MNQHDLIVIGSGPGGYVAAVRAAQLGLNVACIEREPVLGGTCLRVGCIPSKALLESSEQYHAARHTLAAHGVKVGNVELDLPALLKRKDQLVGGLTKGVEALFKKNKITRYAGHGCLAGPGRVNVLSEPPAQAGGQAASGRDNVPSEPPAQAGGQANPTLARGARMVSLAISVELQAKHILIATGSKSAALKGVELDYDRIGTSTEALAYPEVPKHLVVIGAGYIGLELGTVWQRLGARVTVLEYLDRILPGTDAEIAAEALKLFKRQGIEFRLGARVTAARRDEGTKGRRHEGEGPECVVECEGHEPIHCDRVLLAVGRVPNTDGLGLENVRIKCDEKGRIPVDEHFATAAPGVYAIGDVIRGPMLAHKASEEGSACVEHLVTGYGHVNYDAIPAVCYTEPEIAGVGQTEDQLKQAGSAYRSGSFQFRGNGRARALGHIDGKVKILADAKTDRILGVHIIGPRAGDLIAEAAVAIEFGASSEDLARCTHAHPTLAEALKEAALAVAGRAIHA
jgi:dihydrolipoamide dehydrogenase